jgi:Putative adhesin
MMTTPASRLAPAPGRLRLTPARVLTLVIGVPLVLALIGWLGFTAVALVGQASYPVSYAIPVTGGQLAVGVAGSDVTLRQGPGRTAHLTGTVQYDLVRPGVSESTGPNGTNLDVRCRIPVGECGLNATLEVPSQTAVTLSTSGGDITANDLAAPSVNAGSGGGDVTLVFTKPPANLDITSDGGDITVLLPQGTTAYHITSSADGGNDTQSVPTSALSANTISVDSGGGDITIAEAS